MPRPGLGKRPPMPVGDRHWQLWGSSGDGARIGDRTGEGNFRAKSHVISDPMPREVGLS